MLNVSLSLNYFLYYISKILPFLNLLLRHKTQVQMRTQKGKDRPKGKTQVLEF